MKLFSNLLKLSLAPFAVVLGLSEVPLGIRNGLLVLKSFDRFRRKEFHLKFSSWVVMGVIQRTMPSKRR